MARKPKDQVDAAAYRHDEATRLNNPEAGNIDAVPKGRETKKVYNWDPREAPQLVWAGKAGLKMAEVKEEMSFEVPLVNLHIHERIAPEAIIRAAKREDAQRSLFADPVLEFSKEIQYYQHEVNWANRLILGDSLQVMSSLLERENMRGKIQMIYLDPPYGIKFGSNFQPKIDETKVKDTGDENLTREVEQIQAFRDTWELKNHSYLSYLRDRLILSRELLTASGSVFVQIGDENVHRVRALLDEVFGEEQFIAQIAVTKTTGLGSSTKIAGRLDYLLWFARDRTSYRYEKLLLEQEDPIKAGYDQVELPDGTRRSATKEEKQTGSFAGRLYMSGDLTKPGPGSKYEIQFEGATRTSKNRWWGMEKSSLERILRAGRGILTDSTLRYLRYFDDSPGAALNNLWLGLGGAKDPRYVVQTNEEIVKRCILMTTDPGDLVLDPTCGSGTTAYVAEQLGRRWITCDTSRVAVAIARHRLLTASFDYYKLRHPNTGIAGGFRYAVIPQISAEAIADIAEIDAIWSEHQPLVEEALEKLTAAAGERWREWEVPRSINDILGAEAKRLSDAARSLDQVETGQTLASQEATAMLVTLGASDNKEKGDSGTLQGLLMEARAAQDHMDRARHKLKEIRKVLDETRVNRERDPIEPLFERFWEAKREMQRRIDQCISLNAPKKELVDQPEKQSGVVRVSGPFTVEAVPNVNEVSLDLDEVLIPADVAEDGETSLPAVQVQVFSPAVTLVDAKNVSAYLSDMIEKLRKVGVNAKGNRRLSFASIQSLNHEIVHAEGMLQIPSSKSQDLEEGAGGGGSEVRCAVIFGPQNGAVSEILVREGLDAARKYDAVLFCGYDFTSAAQERLQIPIVGQQAFMAYIAPDTAMTDLLKDTKASQIFTLVGEPDVVIYRHGDPSLNELVANARKRGADDVVKRHAKLQPGEVFLELRGVDLYNPTTGEVTNDSGRDVHAIFVDHDYDGKSFCICQALFPNKKDSWEKIAKALKGSVDHEAFEAFRTQVTLPFRPGENMRVQVKVIDTRGNAVVKTVRL